MTNKLVRVQNRNPSYLSFGFNKKVDLINGDWSYSGIGSMRDMAKYGPAHAAVILHGALSAINLVTEVSVKAYEITVQIADAFEDDAGERARVLDEATEIIDRILFGADGSTIITDKDNRERHAAARDYDEAA